jgi:hypothetical protein
MEVYDFNVIREVILDGREIKDVRGDHSERDTRVVTRNKVYLVPDKDRGIFKVLNRYYKDNAEYPSINLIGYIGVQQKRKTGWEKTKFSIVPHPLNCSPWDPRGCQYAGMTGFALRRSAEAQRSFGFGRQFKPCDCSPLDPRCDCGRNDNPYGPSI